MGNYKKPDDYNDLGWQLNYDHPALKACREAGHQTKHYDNSLYQNRGTHHIVICDECKYIHNFDSSD